jgi:hypothetical protein
MKLTKGKLSKIMNKRKQSMKRYKKQRKYRPAGKTFRKRKPLNLHYSSIKKLMTPKKIEWIGGQEEEPNGKVPSVVVEEGHSAVESTTSEPITTKQVPESATIEPATTETATTEPATTETATTEPATTETATTEPATTEPATTEPATGPTQDETSSVSSLESQPDLEPQPVPNTNVEQSVVTDQSVSPQPEPVASTESNANDPTTIETPTNSTPPAESETASVPTIVKTETEQAVTPQPVQPNTPLEDAINYISNKIADAVVKKMGTSTSDNQDAEQSIPTMAYAMQQTTSNQQGGKRKTRRSRHNSQHVTHKMYHNF